MERWATFRNHYFSMTKIRQKQISSYLVACTTWLTHRKDSFTCHNYSISSSGIDPAAFGCNIHQLTTRPIAQFVNSKGFIILRIPEKHVWHAELCAKLPINQSYCSIKNRVLCPFIQTALLNVQEIFEPNCDISTIYPNRHDHRRLFRRTLVETMDNSIRWQVRVYLPI